MSNVETKHICPSCQQPLAPELPLGLCPGCLMKSGFNTGVDPSSTTPHEPGLFPPRAEELAKLFPQLELLTFIGRGGMGAVYKARQTGLDRLVALKILPPAAASDPGFAERFNREARALARLNHPNIVTVHDFGQAGTFHYLIMEFVDGPNLRQVERAGRLAPEEALLIVPQICDALQFAHNEGIVHRDIKPENILLDRKGRVKITDFGIAKIVGRSAEAVALTGIRDVVGTPHYMAPEQVERPGAVDHRADIYSLGVVFYEMLTGHLPLGRFAPPSRSVQVDVRLDEVVLRTLEHEPHLRFQQASQVRTAVEVISQTPEEPKGASTANARAFPAAAGSGPGSQWWTKVFVVSFTMVFLMWCAAWAFDSDEVHGVPWGLLSSGIAGVVAVGLGCLARKGLLLLVLTGVFLLGLLWFGVTLLVEGDKRETVRLVPSRIALALTLVGSVWVAWRSRLPRRSVVAFTVVFLVVFGLLVGSTQLWPKSYTAIARVKIVPHAMAIPARSASSTSGNAYDPYLIQTECENIRSDAIFREVLEHPDLVELWKPRDGVRTGANVVELGARPVPKANLLEIRAGGSTRDRAVLLANTTASIYEAHCRNALETDSPGAVRAEIVRMATPWGCLEHPNKPLNVAIAALAATALGLAAGTTQLASRKRSG